MRNTMLLAGLSVVLGVGLCPLVAADERPGEWRSLPLIKDGKVDPSWVQVGWGGFAVEDGTLRTDCDEKGLGLLLYRREKFGNCQIRVVYKSKDAKSNSGVFVRIDDGILKKIDEKHAAARRDKDGKLTKESLETFMDASEKGLGPWYAVHHGYEIQICDETDPYHRTGAVYSLAKATAAVEKPPTEWKTMVITLDGGRVIVDVEGKRVATFDPAGKDVPAERKWFEPRREPKRPTVGYIGLQNHDPGDVVYFKEVSVRPLNSPLEAWLKPQDWRRDSDSPALGLGEKGKFDDQHIFAPHVISQDGEFWMYYCGSQRCVDAGTYKGKAKDPAHPEKSDQRLFKLGLARSKDGVHFTRHSTDPVFSFGDDIHSVVTAAILKNPDGSVHREGGKMRMYFAAVDFPGGTYKHDLYETTSADGIRWGKPTRVMENAYAPCVMKEGDRYRMWYTCIDRHPWFTKYAESPDGTRWTIRETPCIVMDHKWEVKDQVYPMVLKADGVYLMLYGCYWNDDKHTALGFAASKDGLTWTKHPDNPVFRPEPKHEWESNFTTSQSLMRLPDGSFRLWYAGRKQPPWSNLYFAIGTAHWKGPGK